MIIYSLQEVIQLYKNQSNKFTMELEFVALELAGIETK